MLFQFSPVIQAAIDAGAYEVVRNQATGQLLGIARDKATGQFVGHAVGMISQLDGLPILNPLVAPPQLGIGGLQMLQTQMGFQKTYGELELIKAGLQIIENSVPVLQASTAVIGIGTVAGVALSAVNLYQTFKLREDIKQLKIEVNNGFIDLKKVFKDQGTEIIQHLEQVAKDLKFEQHRLVLIQAYGKFRQGIKLIRISMSCADTSIRNIDLANARQTLTEALADYNNSQLLSEICAAGQLRRLECAWAIEQTIALTYQLQNQPAAATDQLSHLQDKIRQDALHVIESCETEDELDFLFPEILRIHNHDLAILASWHNHLDWIQSLPSSELKLLQSTDFSNSKIAINSEEINDVSKEALLPEQLLYENLQQKSHFLSLRDQLQFTIKPSLRHAHESYISRQAPASGYPALALSNWQEITDLTVANLYWYFKVKDES